MFEVFSRTLYTYVNILSHRTSFLDFRIRELQVETPGHANGLQFQSSSHFDDTCKRALGGNLWSYGDLRRSSYEIDLERIKTMGI